MQLSIHDKEKKEVFASFVCILKNTARDVHWIFTPETWRIEATDASQISLLQSVWKTSWFDTYSFSPTLPQQELAIVVDANDLANIFGAKTDKHNIHVECREGQEDALFIRLESVVKEESTKTFRHSLLSAETSFRCTQMPVIEYDAEVELPTKHLRDVLSQLADFGHDVDIYCDEEVLYVETPGNTSMRVDLNTDATSMVEQAKYDAKYSLQLFSKAVVPSKLCGVVILNMLTDYPMKLHYDIKGGNTLDYYLAPKIKD